MRTIAKIRLFVTFVLVSLLTVGCLSNDEEALGPVAIEFTNMPGVTEVETPDIVISLSGTVQSVAEIEAVQWSNDRGGKGIANGREEWVTGNIVLQLGVNNITVTATNSDGDTASKSISVTRENTFAPSATGHDQPVVMYSYSSQLDNAAPVEDATILAGTVYFFVEPGERWNEQGVAGIRYECCSAVAGPSTGAPASPMATSTIEPWVYVADLNATLPGDTRRVSVSANLSSGTQTDWQHFDFTIGAGGYSGNRAPTISGNPSSVATVGNQYNFRPVGQDADGDTLRFTIAKKPAWAAFDSTTGRLHGTPASAHVGTYRGITITVSDGHSSTSLPAFDIRVEPSGVNSATLTWTAPTQRTDNSPLTNLAGFNLYYGQTPGDYGNRLQISNAGLSSYVVDNLSSGDWYFVLTAVDRNGLESNPSNRVIRSYP